MSVAGQQGTQEPGGDVEVTEAPTPVETVPAPEEPEEGGEGGEPAAAAQPNHRERKANRMREAKERAEAAERAARESSERLARVERENAEIRGYLTAQREQRQAGDPQAELNARITRMRQDAQGHLERSALASKAGDRATAEAELQKYHDAIEEATMARIEARMAPQIEERIAQVQGSVPSPEMMAIRDRIGQEFPQAYSNRRFNALTDSIVQEMVSAGRPMGYETIRAACAEASKMLGIGGRQAPTTQTRQRLTAVPGGEGGGGGGDGAVEVPWGPAEKQLAHKAFPKLEPAEAKKKWLAAMAAAKRKGEW